MTNDGFQQGVIPTPANILQRGEESGVERIQFHLAPLAASSRTLR
jgi:hypothetical protein